MIKLVIFDLDGTLLNTLDDLADSCNYILRKHNLPEHSVDSYRFFIGNGVANLVKRALPEEQRSPEFIEQIRKEFVEYYTLHAEDKTAPYPGIVEMLEHLQSDGVKLAVASNKFNKATQTLAEKYFPSIRFVSVLGQREGVPIKPDPQIVYDTLEVAKISQKESVLYVGDSGADMETAVNSLVEGIGVLWGFRPEEELKANGATYIINTPQDILEIVETKKQLVE